MSSEKKNRLFVGNISWDTGNDELRRAFSAFGEVTDASVVLDRESGRSRGFAFVQFSRAEDARAALALNETMLDGRKITVREAEERPPTRREGPQGGRRDGDERGRW